MDLCQTHCKHVPDISRASKRDQVTWSKWAKYTWRPPVPTFVLWLFVFRSAPSTFPLHSPPFGVCFRESLVFRLDSEIDQIHLSIEAQCGTTCLPMGDCHFLPPPPAVNNNRSLRDATQSPGKSPVFSSLKIGREGVNPDFGKIVTKDSNFRNWAMVSWEN